VDKKTAQQLIEDTFSTKFNENQFTLFIKNFLNDIEQGDKIRSYSGNYIWDDHREHINTYKRIGKYIDPEGDALDVLIVEVKSVAKLERARTSLRNFVIKHLNKFGKDIALVAFYSKEDDGEDWRFSFIKREYQSYLDEEKQKVKTRKKFSPAKRYSFLVGKYEKTHTAKTQILPLLQNIANNPTIQDIENAFSIEKVTDEFFAQYKDLYVKLFEHFENDAHIQSELAKTSIDNTRFTKKLLGQIVFLYFLQKKGWLGVPKNETWGKGQRQFIQNLFDEAQSENKNYFKDYLQPLFYEALAKERNDENSYYERFNCRIPFLNGGLFEAEYDWQNANITIPESLFRNEEKNKAGDTGTGVLDVFDRYNFTIKEDEPLDKEVAVDPEMLGKVFENMLEITERKSKGAFYTPREIVHYMCQESLIHYLDNSLNNYAETYQELGNNQLNFLGNQGSVGQQSLQIKNQAIKVPKTDIETYIRNGHFALENDQRAASKGETRTYQYQLPQSIRQNADLIDQKLTEIRICDPAIGSGAFPVGLLHELVNAQLVIKPHLSNAYLNKKLDGFGFQFRESINESRYVYRLKRQIIQESIYGVDIDASAIDIARLRLWLSLVVDEDNLDPIETLPNLDYKIVCGNSLIGMPENAMHDLNIEKELEAFKEEFYNQTNESKKKALRTQINSKIRELLDSAEQFAGYKIDFDFKLFFSEVWREKGGFDVVIGNPPYVRVQGIDKISKDVFKKLYFSATGKYDLYVLFLEKGDKIQNKRGNLIFINPNKFFNADYGIGIRNYYAKNKNAKAIIDFGDTQNFSTATTYTCIIQTTSRPAEFFNYHLWNPKNSILRKLSFTSRKHFEIGEKWELLSNEKAEIFEKLKLGGKPLIEYTEEIFQGLISGGDKYFLLELLNEKEDYYECKSLFNGEIYLLEKAVTRKLLKGKEAKAHKLPKTKYITIYPYKKQSGKTQLLSPNELQKYPKTFEYLNSMKYELENRGSASMEYQSWYAMWNNREIDKFESPKLLTQVLSGFPNFGVDKDGDYWFVGGGNAGVYGIIPKDSELLLFFSGLLNSEILAFFIAETSTKFRGGYFSFAKRFLADFPVKVNDDFIFPVSIFADYLYYAPLNSIEYAFLSQLLNSIIYELYFPEELKSANKEILKHLGDLKPITDEMSDEEKLATIQGEFERLNNPNHPVRNAIETLDSVEEVAIIKKSLDK